MDERGRDPRAGHAEGMTDRDGAAVNVQLVDVNVKLAGGRKNLRGERLVDLDQVDVGHCQAGVAQCLAAGLDGPHAHDLG